jgi:hypothetical protein
MRVRVVPSAVRETDDRNQTPQHFVSRPFHGLVRLTPYAPAVNCWAIIIRPLTRTKAYSLVKAASTYKLFAPDGGAWATIQIGEDGERYTD